LRKSVPWPPAPFGTAARLCQRSRHSPTALRRFYFRETGLGRSCQSSAMHLIAQDIGYKVMPSLPSFHQGLKLHETRQAPHTKLSKSTPVQDGGPGRCNLEVKSRDPFSAACRACGFGRRRGSMRWQALGGQKHRIRCRDPMFLLSSSRPRGGEFRSGFLSVERQDDGLGLWRQVLRSLESGCLGSWWS